MINDESAEVIKELFDSLRKRNQDNLKSMKRNEFVLDYVDYKSWNKSELWQIITDSPDWIKNKKVTIISINKKDDKCFQYAVTVALHHEQIEKDPQRIIKLIFLSKYNWGEIVSHKKMTGSNLQKIMWLLLIMFCMLKKKKYVLLIFQNIIQIMKNKSMMLFYSKKAINIITRNNV